MDMYVSAGFTSFHKEFVTQKDTDNCKTSASAVFNHLITQPSIYLLMLKHFIH